MSIKFSLKQFPFNRLQDIFKKKHDAVIVVDIGASLRLLNVDLKGKPRVTALKAIALPAQEKTQAVLNALSAFIRENKITHKDAVLSVSPKVLSVKRVQLPSIPQSELYEAAQWRIKEELPYDLTEAVLDFEVIRESVKEAGEKVLDVKCVSARQSDIKPDVLLLKQAGLNCLTAIPLPCGYSALLERYSEVVKDESIGILYIDEDTCYLSIHKNGKLELYRELPVSIGKLRGSLRGVLTSERGKVELNHEEIDDILFNHGIPTVDFALYKDKMAANQILAMLRPDLERLAQEISRSLNYNQTQFGGTRTNKIFLCGAAANIPNLDTFLSKEFSLNIQDLSLPNNEIAVDNINAKDLTASYVYFGMAIDYEHRINLLPREFRVEKFEKLQKMSLRWVIIIASLFLVFSYLFSWVGVAAYKKRMESSRLHLGVLSEIKVIKDKTDSLNKFIGDIKRQEPAVALVLKTISRVVDKNIFIDNFTLDCENRSGIISGSVKDIDQNADIALTKFADDLENSDYFTDVSIDSVAKSAESVRFIINFRLR